MVCKEALGVTTAVVLATSGIIAAPSLAAPTAPNFCVVGAKDDLARVLRARLLVAGVTWGERVKI